MSASTLSAQVEDYLAMREELGFDIESQRWALRDFAHYARQQEHRGPITADLAMRWALSASSGQPARAERRLAHVRRFAVHRVVYEPKTEVPAAGSIARIPRRRHQPHIYSDAEVSALLSECARLLPHNGLRPRTYAAFFSLLASTGLRLSEARHLTSHDVDLEQGVLMIREAKFRKERLVPLHPTSVEALAVYARRRDASLDVAQPKVFFCTDRGQELQRAAIEKTFSRIRDRLGWSSVGRAGRPRIHDLRHTFAVRRLLRWYKDGVDFDVDRKILALATYLGHAKVTDTYWYLSAVPELLAVTSDRFQQFARADREVTL